MTDYREGSDYYSLSCEEDEAEVGDLTANHPYPVQHPKTRPPKVSERPFSTGRLPNDVLELVYNHCDLETCVLLRSVSCYWYFLFEKRQKMLEMKLKERNSVFKPGKQTQSWRHGQIAC